MFESPMSTDADFARILRRNIDEGTAYVVHDSGADPKVIGAAIWRPGLRRIAWLAVAEDHRRSGVGASLLSAIFEAAGPGSIVVETFGTDVPGGIPARRFYEAAGFRRVGPVAEGAAPSSRDLFRRA